jgi:hypothetical protein
LVSRVSAALLDPYRGHPGDAEAGGHGEHVDDGALAARGHDGRERAHQDVGRLDVDRIDRVDVGVAGVRGGAERVDAGVVDEDVDVAAAELSGGPGQGTY